VLYTQAEVELLVVDDKTARAEAAAEAGSNNYEQVNSCPNSITSG